MKRTRNFKQYLLSNSNKTQIVIAIGVIIVLIAAFYGFKSKTAVKQQRAGEVNPAVDVRTITRKDMMKNIILTGQTVPVSQVDIVAKYPGKITQVNVDLGQSVTGQALIVQDDSDVNILLAQNRASLREANADAIESKADFQASYEKAQSDYQYSQTNYQRYKTLFDQGAISKETLDNTAQQVTTARAALILGLNKCLLGVLQLSRRNKRRVIKLRLPLMHYKMKKTTWFYVHLELCNWFPPSRSRNDGTSWAKTIINC